MALRLLQVFGNLTNLINVTNRSNIITATGKLSDLNAALNGLTYIPNVNYFGKDTLQLISSDHGNSGAGIGLSTLSNVPISILQVNQVPVITAPSNIVFPGIATNSQANTIVLSGANGIAISDIDAAGKIEQVTITATNGTIALGSTAAITITSGSNNSSSITFTGSVDQLNNALSYVKYFTTGGGGGTVTLSVNDLNNSSFGGAKTATQTININAQRPIFHGLDAVSTSTYTPGGPAVYLDTNVTISDFNIDSITNNNPYYTGATFTISRVGGADPSDIFQVSKSNFPGGVTYNSIQNDSNNISIYGGIMFTYSNSGIVFRYNNGLATFTCSGSGWGGPILASNINYVLQNITYSNIKGTVPSNLQFQYVFNDGSGTATAITTGYITLNTVSNNVPSILSPVNTVTFTENSNLLFKNNNTISVIDRDTSNLQETINLIVSNGTLCLNNLSGINIISGSNGSNNITFTGTISQINTALANLSYNPTFNYTGNSILNITLTYQHDAKSNIITSTAAINLQGYNYTTNNNVQPVIHNLDNISPDVYTVNSNAAITVNHNVNISDQVHDLLNHGLGDYSNTMITIMRAGGGNYHDIFSFTSMADITLNGNALIANGNIIACFNNLYGQLQIQFLNNGTIPTKTLFHEILQAVQYKTTEINSSGEVNLVYTFDNGSGLGTNSVATTTTTVNIIADNYTPIINISEQTQNINLAQNSLNQQSSTINFQGQITIADPYNVGDSMETIVVVAKHGKLAFDNYPSLNLINVVNNANSITATGKVADLNLALQTLNYSSNNGYVGTDVIKLIVNNNNPNGQFAGNLLSASYVNLNISQIINQAPGSIVPSATQYVNQNNNLIFNNNLSISVNDQDAGNTLETITLTTNNGQLSFGSNTNDLINYTTDSNTITATGTISALKAALSGLIYTPDFNYLGMDQIKLTINDNNNLSINGPIITNNTINIVVTIPADNTIITAPLSINNNLYNYIFAGANAIRVTNSDLDNDLMSVTLSAFYGTINLSNLTSSGVIVTTGANNSNLIIIKGTVSQVNNALNNLMYIPNSNSLSNSLDNLNIVVNNLTDLNATVTKTIDINTNVNTNISGLTPASTGTYIENFNPTINATNVININKNNSLNLINKIFVGNSNVNDQCVLNLTIDQGTLSLINDNSGVVVLAGVNGSHSISLKGSISQLNNAIAKLLYIPDPI